MLGVYVKEEWRFVMNLESGRWMSVACGRCNGKDKAPGF